MLPGTSVALPRGGTARRLPLVRQLEIGDCGAACLAMVLRSYGRRAHLSELRDLTGTGRDGVSAAGLVSAARHLGLEARGLRCPAEHLAELPPGAILHWDHNHFVVLERRTRAGWRILDPSLGRRTVSDAQLAERYSGVALVFEASEDGAAGPSDSERIAWRSYRPFVAGTGRPATGAVLFAIAVQGFALAHPLVLRRIVDGLTTDPATPDLGRTLAIAVVGLAIGYLAVYVGRLLSLLALQRLVDFRLTLGLLHHLVSLPYSFIARRSTGDLALRLRSTVVVRQILTSGALSALLDGGLVLVYFVLILVVDTWFGVLTVVALAAQCLVVWATWGRLRSSSATALEAQSRSQSRLLELLSGIEVLKVSGAAPSLVEAWADDLRREVDAQIERSRLGGVVDAVLLTIRFAAPPAMLALGFSRVSSGALSLGDMLALAALSAAITVPTGNLLQTVCSLTTVGSYVERLDDLLRSRPESSGDVIPEGEGPYEVRLDDVSYRYSPFLPPAVHGVTLTVRPGQHVAILGPSGSGKTTLAMLLATLYEPTTGAVSVDGVDVREHDVAALRRSIGVVTQATQLFAVSVRENIRLGRSELTDEQIEDAARIAAVHEEILELPAGYDTLLGEAGAGLSGGQRQRLALARAVAGRPWLLVLDEATSALDPVTDAAVHRAIADLECTTIVVGHRPSYVRSADRVLVLAAGSVVADGSPARVRRTRAFRALADADAAT